MSLRFLLLNAAGMAFMAAGVYAQVELPSKIGSDMTIDETDFYYYVPDGSTTTIGDEATLTIGRGVEVRLGAGSDILVDGGLIVDGTSSKPARFVPLGKAAWGHIAFRKASRASTIAGAQVIGAAGEYAVSITESPVVVRNSRFTGNQSGVIQVWGERGEVVIEGNSFDDNRGQTVRVYAGHGTQVLKNSFGAHQGGGSEDVIDFEYTNGGVIKGNVIEESVDECIDLDYSSNIVIESNKISRAGDHLMTIKASEEISLKDNILTDSNKGVYFFVSSTVQSENNTYYKINSSSISGDGGSSGSVKNSIFLDSSTPGGNVSVKYSIANSGQLPDDPTNIEADPMLEDPANGDFALKAGSPAAGSGEGNVDMGAPPNLSLPVELVSFSGIVVDDQIFLTWATESEFQNTGFEIHQSNDGERFETIGFVDGAGTTTEMSDYNFSVANLTAGFKFFRLKQIDFDGTSAFSNVLKVEVDMPDNATLYPAYPNPFNPTTSISFVVGERSDVTLDLFDSLGRHVRPLHRGLVGAKQAISVTIEASDLPSGSYFVRLMGDGLHAKTQQITLVK